jgi:hypothetical protein
MKLKVEGSKLKGKNQPNELNVLNLSRLPNLSNLPS